MTDKKDSKNTEDREVPSTAQTAPSDPQSDSKNAPKTDAERSTDSSTHVVQHLDRDPNDPRNAEPTPVLPSLDDKETQGPEHGRVSQEDDHSATGQNGPNV